LLIKYVNLEDKIEYKQENILVSSSYMLRTWKRGTRQVIRKQEDGTRLRGLARRLAFWEPIDDATPQGT
jgi:hypothetical protein